MEHRCTAASKSGEREPSSAAHSNLRGHSTRKDFGSNSLYADSAEIGPQGRAFPLVVPLAVPVRHSLPILMRSLVSGLTVNQRGDQLEQEADHAADQVMRMADPAASGTPLKSTGAGISLWRKCAQCEEEEDKERGKLLRNAAGTAPGIAPPIVHEVLNSPGQPLDPATRGFMEPRFGHDFSQVRIHTDERAAASAEAVAAHAYTVGPHIVFAPRQFDPVSPPGRRLLAHELVHAAAHSPGLPTPSGTLRISTPSDPAERHAVAVSEGFAALTEAPATAYTLLRQGSSIVALAGLTINQKRVTVPPEPTLSFSATRTPANAPGVTLSIVGVNATIDPGTTIDNTTGAITVAAAQTGGSARIEATQNATAPDGSTLVSTTPFTAPFHFTAIPSAITSTTASRRGIAGLYGGDFTHTFSSPAGGQTAVERSHVNEQFAAAKGTTLTLKGPLGTVTVAVNDANSATAGWDLDSSGEMVAPDHVDWGNTIDARPFVANASNPSPSPGLPLELTATQNFRNLSFPSRSYGAPAVASTTHRRAIEDRSTGLKAVTSANAPAINEEVEEDYVGPTVFRNCVATPNSIPAAIPPSKGGTAPVPTTSTISVSAQGKSATPKFSVRPPDLGCKITAGGVLTPGTTAGTVTVRAGDSTNYDETTVTITAQPATPTTNPNPNPTP